MLGPPQGDFFLTHTVQTKAH